MSRQCARRHEILAVVLKSKGEAYVGRVRFVEGVEQPEHNGSQQAQEHRLPIGAVKMKYLDDGLEQTHEAIKVTRIVARLRLFGGHRFCGFH